MIIMNEAFAAQYHNITNVIVSVCVVKLVSN